MPRSPSPGLVLWYSTLHADDAESGIYFTSEHHSEVLRILELRLDREIVGGLDRFCRNVSRHFADGFETIEQGIVA